MVADEQSTARYKMATLKTVGFLNPPRLRTNDTDQSTAGSLSEITSTNVP